ncbi:hypothetical protein HIM_07809 [Hirsutella minnesotensis 3608]|uniref:DUF7702 domain-containing protein n=1 Tax=Hirsutella minnesotensis 3608 TaxID=1043627 RepID=A0A0F7ZMZ6_9HYPO|nr:hypothetical protein HIM_07809 [Hirsutella minnesotensis 3608]
MTRPLDAYDDIAIATIVVYSACFVGAVFLCFKHGLARSSGWSSLMLLSVARLIGSALRLSYVSQPTNVGLYIGWMTLNNIGLGPLILILLGLLGRVFQSINRQGHVVVKPTYHRLTEILMLVAIILIAVGGSQSNYSFDRGQLVIQYSSTSHAGLGLAIVVLALLFAELFLAFRNQGYVAQGEHRIILAVVISLPFVIVRLIYSCLVVFGGVRPDVWIYLGMLVIMEMIVVLICEVLGFTLGKAPPAPSKEDHEMLARGGR